MKPTQRILIVDDEDAILFSFRKLLQSATVMVDGCMTLEEALALIENHPYDAIITDLRLSHSEGEEGLEIIEYTKTHRPNTPVIILTGYGNDEIKERALALGAFCYFDKPVQIAVIIQVLRNIGIRAGES